MLLLRFASPLLSQSCARSLFVAAVLVSGFCSQANAQALPLVDQVKGVKSADRFDVERLNAINTFMNKAVEDGVIVGSSALIFQDGKEAFFNTWGYHDRANKRPMSRDAIFRIYSMTKPITSVAAMQLVEQGKMKLDDAIFKYLPEFENLQVFVTKKPGQAAGKESRNMTVRDLLRHTSGLSYGFFDVLHPVDQKYLLAGVLATDKTLAETVQKLSRIPLKYAPGTYFEYSASTDVLARLVEVVSGESFDNYLQENIFNPLHMSDTHFVVPEEKQSRLVTMYSDDGSGGLVPTDPAESRKFVDNRNKFFSGGGGLCSTIDDYLSFMKMLMNNGETSSGRCIIKPATLKEMFSDQLDGIEKPPTGGRHAGTPWGVENFRFGLGFAINEPKYGTDYEWGGIAGTRFWVNPESGTAMIYMVQVFPLIDHDLSGDFRRLVYEALKEE